MTAEKKNLDVEIVDLARFCAEALGFENFPDPHPEVQAQWAVFEAMIELMTPAGFAALMGTMWPELIDAMPFGMGKMMRVMGKVPGAMGLMKPMFPFLFPKLLPMMMPKVMDTMLERVADYNPDARLYGGADAGYYARRDGQPDAAYDRRCCTAGHRSDDRVSEERLKSRNTINKTPPTFDKLGVFLYVCVHS